MFVIFWFFFPADLGKHNNLICENTQIRLSHHLLIRSVYFLIINGDLCSVGAPPTPWASRHAATPPPVWSDATCRTFPASVRRSADGAESACRSALPSHPEELTLKSTNRWFHLGFYGTVSCLRHVGGGSTMEIFMQNSGGGTDEWITTELWLHSHLSGAEISHFSPVFPPSSLFSLLALL